jgi:hypothetical protein
VLYVLAGSCRSSRVTSRLDVAQLGRCQALRAWKLVGAWLYGCSTVPLLPVAYTAAAPLDVSQDPFPPLIQHNRVPQVTSTLRTMP